MSAVNSLQLSQDSTNIAHQRDVSFPVSDNLPPFAGNSSPSFVSGQPQVISTAIAMSTEKCLNSKCSFEEMQCKERGATRFATDY